MKLYRITNKKYANFDGIGGIHVAGKWNMKGHRVIYVAESISLAAWEKFVHITDYRDFPTDLVVITINIPDNIKVKEVPKFILAPGWDITLPFRAYKSETMLFGTEFLTQNTHLALKVPSAVISTEYNYLLNPNHPDIKKCTIEKIEAFKFDIRMNNLGACSGVIHLFLLE